MPTFPDVFGAYFWAGLDVPNALVPGLRILQQSGFRSTARIRLTPAVRPKSAADRGEYRFDEDWETEVPTSVPFLPAAVRSAQYQRAFALPGLNTFVFTAYDSASTGPYGDQLHLLDFEWLETNAELVQSEYRDMTLALYETQHDTDKRFIVCNWETDNNIYFDEVPPFASAVKRLSALRRWFQLRQEGIRQGRAMAEASGLGGIEVNDAIEFNNFRYRQEYFKACDPGGFVGDTLNDIIPDVKPDYASFSTWISTGRGRFYDDLITIKSFLNTATDGHSQLMIGELGVTAHSRVVPEVPLETISSKIWKYANLAHAASRADIPVIILWKAWDYFGHDEKDEAEGLFNGDGTERQVLRDLRDSFGPAVSIGGVVDQFDLYGWRAPDERRYFEVYGSFPEARPGNVTQAGWAGNYVAIIEFSDGEIVKIPTWGESETQVNLALTPDARLVRWFNLRLRRHRDGLTSPEFGPLRLNRIPPESASCEGRVTERYWDYWG